MTERLDKFADLYERGGQVHDDAGLLGRQLRLARGRQTATDLCTAIGVYPNHLNRVEAGQASMDSIQKVAGALGYDVKLILVRKVS